MHIRVRGLSCTRGSFSLKGISFDIRDNGYFVLLGPTGSGKTTLLKCLLGIFKLGTGQIFFDDLPVHDMPVEKRNIGYVPQELALFPHLSVKENITYGMRVRKKSTDRMDKALKEICNMLGINYLAERPVSGLSGGEKQKVAIARALVIQPKVLFLDEPFSSIDEGSRRELWLDLKKVVEQFRIPVIHITHNLEEAYALGEQFGIIMDGSVDQTGHREDIFLRPANSRIALFLSYRNIFKGEVIEKETEKRYLVRCGSIEFRLDSNKPLTGEVEFCIRAQDIKIVQEGIPLKSDLKHNVFSGELIASIFYPNTATIFFKNNGSNNRYDFEINFPSYIYNRYNLSVGKKINVAIWQPNIIFFKK